MKTKIFSSRQIKEAAELIMRGELVAFPTETVYGLGADGLNPTAVRKIFLAKGRPSDNPLIVHIAQKERLGEIAIIPSSKKVMIERLIDRFWPGPLTIILKKREVIPKEVTAGLSTVAVRMPKNKVALSLIRHSGVPIAAPSANISGKPSGTCFEHVLDDFDGKISGIVKSKECDIGLESTVLDLTARVPLILRPGGVTYESLKKVVPSVKFFESKSKKPKSPGIKYKHYSPDAEIILFERGAFDRVAVFREELKRCNKRVLVLKAGKIKKFHKKMFRIFRECDKKRIDSVL
jgi:L-threonylcarbamoyladenylate synthase